MALTVRRWTRGELDRLPADGNRYEVVDGALLVSPPPSVRHERIHHFLARVLQPFLDRHGLGLALNGRPAITFGSSQVEPDLVVSPNVLPVPERWDSVPRPLLVVEVLSPATARADLDTKRDLYLREGIPEYWIVDGDARTVRVITPAGERVEAQTLRWVRAEAPEPLDIDLVALFNSALGPAGTDQEAR